MNNDLTKEKIFFYATKEEAEVYDIIEEMTQPLMGFIHDTMVDLIRYSLGKSTNELDLCVLDIGSGTGAEALRILSKYQNVKIVAVDFSKYMNIIFENKLKDIVLDNSEVMILEEDFLCDKCNANHLLNQLYSISENKSYDIIITGFMFHHYTVEQKINAYKRMFKVLRKGGILIHGDLFSYQSKELTSFSHDFGEEWIRKQFTYPSQELVSRFEKIKHIASKLKEEWIEHWNNYHILNPVKKVEDNISHTEMLEMAGFCEIECPFRLWEVGIIWAKK